MDGVENLYNFLRCTMPSHLRRQYINFLRTHEYCLLIAQRVGVDSHSDRTGMAPLRSFSYLPSIAITLLEMGTLAKTDKGNGLYVYVDLEIIN